MAQSALRLTSGTKGFGGDVGDTGSSATNKRVFSRVFPFDVYTVSNSWGLFRAPESLTITKVSAIAPGADSNSWVQIRMDIRNHPPSTTGSQVFNSPNYVTVDLNGIEVTTFLNSSISSGQWLWLTYYASSGQGGTYPNPDFLILTVELQKT